MRNDWRSAEQTEIQLFCAGIHVFGGESMIMRSSATQRSCCCAPSWMYKCLNHFLSAKANGCFSTYAGYEIRLMCTHPSHAHSTSYMYVYRWWGCLFMFAINLLQRGHNNRIREIHKAHKNRPHSNGNTFQISFFFLLFLLFAHQPYYIFANQNP